VAFHRYNVALQIPITLRLQSMSAPEETRSRTQIIRDVLIFQAKLWLEGFKDIALMPLSAGAAAIDSVFGGNTLYGVMRWATGSSGGCTSTPRWRTIPRKRRPRPTFVHLTTC
jgi:hypothetical protein